ncbi:MAG: asparaginase [Rikenellaceae bacterium]
MNNITLQTSLLLVFLLNISITTLYSQDQELPKVTIIATGGTIAGSAESNATTKYKAGVLSVDQIIASVKGIEQIADIEAVQFLNIASQNLSSAKQLELASFIAQTLQREEITGVIVTHGTDTMEESAYLLSLLVSSPKPVILVGAMRPSTGLGADGPANLYAAVVAATSESSRGRGAMVMMNDELLLARDVVKFNTIKTDSFKAPNSSAIGSVVNGEAEYLYPSFERICFDEIPQSSLPLPKVAVLYGHVDSDPKLVDFLVAEGYKGIVFAGVGHGNTNNETLEALSKAAKSGVAVVRASRVPTGEVNSHGEVDDTEYGFTSAHRLNSAKARVLLQLALIESDGDSAKALAKFDQMKY